MEDIGGRPLQRVVEAGVPCPLGRFFPIALALAETLEAVHRAGVLHLGLRPQSVLMNPDRARLQLVDFADAARGPSLPAPPGPPPGPLFYTAPEQTGRLRAGPDARSDLYSLGALLHELLAGRRPFAATEPPQLLHCHLARTPAPLDELGTVPSALAAVIPRLLAKAPERRYQSAAGLRADTCCGASSIGPATAGSSPSSRVPPTTRRACSCRSA